jgi:hypothetical protein
VARVSVRDRRYHPVYDAAAAPKRAPDELRSASPIAVRDWAEPLAQPKRWGRGYEGPVPPLTWGTEPTPHAPLLLPSSSLPPANPRNPPCARAGRHAGERLSTISTAPPTGASYVPALCWRAGSDAGTPGSPQRVGCDAVSMTAHPLAQR